MTAMIEIGGFLALAALTTGLFARLGSDVYRLGERIDKRIDGLDKRIDGLDKRIDDLGEHLGKRIDDLDERLGKRIDVVDERLRAVEHGQAKIEGLLEGLREAISGRRAA